MKKYTLSDESIRFIENLRLYLFSKGKNMEEINEIVEELEVHLMEAEKAGKDIEEVVGNSPQEYMQMISKEMKIDVKAWLIYIPLILIGSFSFTIFGNLLEGYMFTLNFSLLQVIGIILHGLLFIAGAAIAFRYISKKKVMGIKQYVITAIPVVLSMLFYVGVLFINDIYAYPMYHLSSNSSIIIAIITAIFVIGFSIWAKSAILPVVLMALHLPSYLLSYTAISEEARLTTGMIISYLIIGGYLFFSFRNMKKEEESKE